MAPLAPGLHALPLGFVNAYLLETDEGLVLVDTGFPKSETKILAAIAALGRAPRDLKHIIATHAHIDHIGSLAALKAATGAQTWMHALDAPLAEGAAMRPVHPSPGLLPLLMFGASRLMSHRVAPTPIDHRIDEDDTPLPFGGLRAVRAPGHCLGQIVLLWPSRRALLAADTCINLRGRPRLPLVNEDAALAKASLRRVAALDFDIAGFGHGPPILADAAAALRQAAA